MRSGSPPRTPNREFNEACKCSASMLKRCTLTTLVPSAAEQKKKGSYTAKTQIIDTWQSSTRLHKSTFRLTGNWNVFLVTSWKNKRMFQELSNNNWRATSKPYSHQFCWPRQWPEHVCDIVSAPCATNPGFCMWPSGSHRISMENGANHELVSTTSISLRECMRGLGDSMTDACLKSAPGQPCPKNLRTRNRDCSTWTIQKIWERTKPILTSSSSPFLSLTLWLWRNTVKAYVDWWEKRAMLTKDVKQKSGQVPIAEECWTHIKK